MCSIVPGNLEPSTISAFPSRMGAISSGISRALYCPSASILHFEILALILAVVGILSLEKRDEIKIPAKLMIIPFVIILASRLLPYLNNSVPLGYDPGIYKYAMEAYQQNLPYLPSENIDLWVRNGFEPGLFMITDLLYLIGL